jgi:hypothetical protein
MGNVALMKASIDIIITVKPIMFLLGANLIGSTKFHTNTFYFCAILINACKHLNKGLIQGCPKMGLTSQKVAKFL